MSLVQRPLRIEKAGQPIASLAAWETLAGPKRPDQWKEGRSAFELARAWIGTGAATMPVELHALLESRPETRGMAVELVHPELRIAFDTHDGETRNADLAFVGYVSGARVGVTVEGKADESFGLTVADALAVAVERRIGNPRSAGMERIRDLASALLPPPRKGLPKIGRLRYQLLTAAAGTLAYAIREGASCGVLVVHEFVTAKTTPELLARNGRDYGTFLRRLAGDVDPELRSGLAGPFRVPGRPLFDEPPPLFIGKVSTDCR